MKSGWKTTEFWVTMAVNVTTLLVMSGAVTPEQMESAAPWAVAVGKAATAIVAVLTNQKYIGARTDLKKENGNGNG